MDRLLHFVQNYFNNCGIQSIHVTPKSDLCIPFDLNLRKLFMEDFDYRSAMQLLLHNATHILLSFSDVYHCNYYLLTLPENGHYLLVGPILLTDVNKDNVSTLLSQTPIGSQPADQLAAYYEKLPLYKDPTTITTLLITFAHELYPEKNISLQNAHMSAFTFATPNEWNEAEDIITQSRLKSHYAYIDLLTDAIKHGDYAEALIQQNKERGPSLLMSHNLTPLQAAKKGLYIENTMYRLTAHNCGIEPKYLRAVSQKFSRAIDELSDLTMDKELRRRMLYAYCEMVRNCKLNCYSPIIQKVMTYIGKHLDDENLSLAQLAQNVNTNSSYLSKLFKTEVNMTLTEYISQARIEKAMEYIKSGNMKIQDIALAVGYTDTAYFTKCFKKRTGLSPTEFQKTWNLTGLK